MEMLSFIFSLMFFIYLCFWTRRIDKRMDKLRDDLFETDRRSWNNHWAVDHLNSRERIRREREEREENKQ